MTKEQKEIVENCLRTFGMLVLSHGDVLDSDVNQAVRVIVLNLKKK
jgi:hypothetical protein